jgi:hypothetical protein
MAAKNGPILGLLVPAEIDHSKVRLIQFSVLCIIKNENLKKT